MFFLNLNKIGNEIPHFKQTITLRWWVIYFHIDDESLLDLLNSDKFGLCSQTFNFIYSKDIFDLKTLRIPNLFHKQNIKHNWEHAPVQQKKLEWFYFNMLKNYDMLRKEDSHILFKNTLSDKQMCPQTKNGSEW